MNFIEAMLTRQKFSSVDVYEEIQYFDAKTGPYAYLVDCDYFVVDSEFMTSIDLYADELLGKYKVIE